MALSAVSDRGAKHKAAALCARYRTKLPINDFRLWDYDQIRVFLDANEGIRRCYAAWIMPGDVLAEVITQLKPNRPDFRSVMVNFLQKELCADQYVNLGQAGYASENKTPLARVFVDLPVGEGRLNKPREMDDSSNDLEPFVPEVK